MKRLRPLATQTVAVLGLLLSGFRAHAELDVFGLGTGRDGALSVSVANTVVNRYAQVSGSLAAGATTISVGSSTGFGAGDLVMIWKCAESTIPASSAVTGLTNLNVSATGSWEFARLASVSSSQLTLTSPLFRSYPAGGLQVVRVPEYTNVTLTTAGRIVPTPWNGSYGGIVAFLANGTLSNSGGINATGAGFRGGIYQDDPSASLGSTGLDLAAPAGAQKGEGIYTNVFGSGFAGRGAFSNAGGGAVAYKAGGAGGGNWGSGGYGGRSEGFLDGQRTVGGYGGDSLRYDMLDHLSFGGGGGAGHGSDGTGMNGGRGGGVIFIRANALTGAGTIQTSGASPSPSSFDGGSGGGAGGTIYLRLAGTAACGSVSATGASGGTVNTDQLGPGGGGGGGRILFQAASGATCNAVVAGGNPGSQTDPSAPDGLPYGAGAGRPGNVRTLSGGLTIPATPLIVSPATGAIYSSTPTISGTTTPNAELRILIDSRPLAAVTADASGNYNYTVPGNDTLARGRHTFTVYGYRDGLYSPAAVRAVALPLMLQDFSVQCVAGGTQLSWTTAAGDAGHTYRPQRSYDGRRFETLSTIPASAERSYSFVDRTAQDRTRWYRLEHVARDSSVSYSALRMISGTGPTTMTLAPNPAVVSATLRLQLRQAASVELCLLNELGLRVYSTPPGAYAAGAHELQVPLQSLPGGVYSLQVRTAGELQTFRLLVHR